MAVARIPSRMAEALRTAWLADKALGNILVPLWSPWPVLVPGGDLAGVRSDQGMRIYAISLASGMRPGKGMRNSCSFSEPDIAVAIASHVVHSKKGRGEWGSNDRERRVSELPLFPNGCFRHLVCGCFTSNICFTVKGCLNGLSILAGKRFIAWV